MVRFNVDDGKVLGNVRLQSRKRMNNTHINHRVLQRRQCTVGRSSVFILDAELTDTLLICRQAMDCLEVPKVFKCQLQSANGRSSQDVAVIEDSDDELCLEVGDVIGGVVECLPRVLLWRETTSSPGWLNVLEKLLKLESVTHVGKADDDDSMLGEILIADADEGLEHSLLWRC